MTRSQRLWIAMTSGWTALAWLFAVSTSLSYLSTARAASLVISVTDDTATIIASTWPTPAEAGHRSAIIHVDRIAAIHPATHGDADVVLRSGATLVLTRTWRERVLRLITHI